MHRNNTGWPIGLYILAMENYYTLLIEEEDICLNTNLEKGMFVCVLGIILQGLVGVFF